MAELKKFLIVLPIEVDGRIYQHGEVIELDEVNAEAYSHALRAVDDEGEED